LSRVSPTSIEKLKGSYCTLLPRFELGQIGPNFTLKKLGLEFAVGEDRFALNCSRRRKRRYTFTRDAKSGRHEKPALPPTSCKSATSFCYNATMIGV